jgi:hypothetical protein
MQMKQVVVDAQKGTDEVYNQVSTDLMRQQVAIGAPTLQGRSKKQLAQHRNLLQRNQRVPPTWARPH